MKTTLFALGAFASLTTAHFNLDFPPARGFDEDKLVQFPCGSFDTPSTTRTPWPLSGGQIALEMGHVQSNVEVFIAIGNDVGSAFNTVVRGPLQETGLGAFCMTGFTLPEGLNITEGTNATIQVITNGDPDGGLYNCADIVFEADAVLATSDVCKNGTGVASSAASISGFPNGTSSTDTTAPSASPTTAAPAATSSKPGAASGLKVGMNVLVLAAGVAFAFAL